MGSTKTYIINMRMDFDDEEKHVILNQIMREAARSALATAMMLKDKRDPQVTYETTDMFEGNKELSVITDDDTPLEPVTGE